MNCPLLSVVTVNILRLGDTCTLQRIKHHSDVIKSAMASQITGVSSVYPSVCPGADQREHQSSASLAFVRRIRRWPVNSPHKDQWRGKCFHLMTSSCIIGSSKDLIDAKPSLHNHKTGLVSFLSLITSVEFESMIKHEAAFENITRKILVISVRPVNNSTNSFGICKQV